MVGMKRIKPFGFMAINMEQEVTDKRVPNAWNQRQSFETWLSMMSQKIGDSLWPQWDSDAGVWVGTAKDRAIALSKADLALMAQLANYHTDRARPPFDSHTNEEWFVEEDDLYPDNNVLAIRFNQYFPTTQVKHDELAKSFGPLAEDALCASIPWRLKSGLQRPRAHQIAYWLGRPLPQVHMARSAWSPSAISGHAYQGLMGCLNIYLRNQNRLSTQEIQDLRKLAVDIGDRRVFAGVHYPSDNAMSWWVALEAVPFLAADGQQQKLMTDFIVDALKSESIVYQHITVSPQHAACVRVLQPWIG